MHKFELFVVLFASFKLANSLKCYHCFETLKLGCYHGKNDTMRVANCRYANESCITYKWETYHYETSNSYVTTSRGCEGEEICNKLMKPKISNLKRGKEERGITCQVCKTDLCNGSSLNKDQIKFLFVVAVGVSILSVLLQQF